MSGFSSAAKWHESLTPEELGHATATSGIHQLSKKHRRDVLAFVLYLTRNYADRNRSRDPGTCSTPINAIRTTDADHSIDILPRQ